MTAAINAVPTSKTITFHIVTVGSIPAFSTVVASGFPSASRILVGESGAEAVYRERLHMAEGGMQMVTKPTSLIVGESGPEFLFVKPMNTNNNTKSGHSDTNPMFMAGGTYKGAQSPYALASDTNSLLDDILQTLQDMMGTTTGGTTTTLPGTTTTGGTGLTTGTTTGYWWMYSDN